MQKHIVCGLLLVAGLIAATGPVVAIDGDFGSPYASGQQIPAGPRTPGEQPAYGGRAAAIPSVTILGGVLVILGAVAAARWHFRSVRLARVAGTE